MADRTRGKGTLVPSAVLGLLGTHGPSSRAEIARSLQVSPATVTQVTKALIARGLVVELTTSPSDGGRPGRLLGLTVQRIGAIGVKVAADHVAGVYLGLDGELGRTWTSRLDARAPDAIYQLAVLLEGWISEYDTGELLGLGVAVPGAVDDQANGAVDAPTLEWRALEVGRVVRQRTQLPVLVENDVNAVTVAERLYGRGREHDSFLTVTIGRGVGAGIIIDGELYRGSGGGAGEIGHTPINPEGPMCTCGNRGCLEAFIGQEALVADAVARGVIGTEEGLAGLQALARAGDPAARGVYTRAGEFLGRALAGVVHTVDPEVVIVLGEGVSDWPLWEAGFEAGFRAHLLPARRAIPVVAEHWFDERWAQGAAALVFAAPFDSSGATGDQGRLVRERLATTIAGGRA